MIDYPDTQGRIVIYCDWTLPELEYLSQLILHSMILARDYWGWADWMKATAVQN